jgi:hypothetical protein
LFQSFLILFLNGQPIYHKQCCRSGSGRIRTFLVGSGRLGPDPDLNKLHYLNFFGICRSHKYFKHHCCLTFWFMKILCGAYFIKKISGKKFAENLFRSGSGSESGTGSGRFQKTDSDPVKNCPDPQL